MPDNKELFAALVKAQAEMGNAPKDGKNPHFRSNYATLQSVVDTIKPVFGKHGLGYVQHFHEMDGGIGIETVILHESGQQLSNGILRVPATKQDAQGYGSAITYGRRYSLQAAVGIAPEDDDGNAACAPAKRPGNGDKPQPTEAQVLNGVLNQIWEKCQTKSMDKPTMLKSMSDYLQRPIASSADLTLTDAREFLEVLKDG
jgi:hypothetical protein